MHTCLWNNTQNVFGGQLTRQVGKNIILLIEKIICLYKHVCLYKQYISTQSTLYQAGQTDGQTDRRTDRQTDRRTSSTLCPLVFTGDNECLKHNVTVLTVVHLL